MSPDLPEHAEKELELGQEISDFIMSYSRDSDYHFTSIEVIGAIEQVKLSVYQEVEEYYEDSDPDYRVGGSLE